MYEITRISVYLNIFNSLNLIYAGYLEAGSNYVKPKLERNNIVNKGLWIRNNRDKKYTSDFIFRANSLDTDNVLQNNYDAFGQNNVAGSAFFSGFNMERNKRSPNDTSKPHSTKIVKCNNNSNCPNVGIESKFISTLKPASIFNDYPYEIAVLLGQKKDYLPFLTEKDIENNEERLNNKEKKSITQQSIKNNLNREKSSSVNDLTYTIFPNENTNKPHANRTSIIPKRSMNQHDYGTELIKKIEFTEDFNMTDPNFNKIDRNKFDKEDLALQNAPTTNINVYKILPKRLDDVKHKSLNERGLLKVLTMLTKTFKKITKQHQDIKRIHNKLYDLNDDFTKNSELLTGKFEDFNSKYLYMMNLNDKLKIMEAKLTEKEQKFNDKEKDMSKNLKEFENQQKKFLGQQRQFYNVQKLMLAQNEKINFKQNEIAKTQSEISHRQINFARILKKAKQILMNSRNMSPTKLNTAIAKPKIKLGDEKVEPLRVVNTSKSTTTTARPETTETVKINLFSIPTLNRLENQDQMILDEKDYQPVDELIYKYYFNNTFIDDLMRRKILATFIAASEATDSNVTKNKRNGKANTTTTLMVPVKNTVESNYRPRSRRWVKHSTKNNQKKSSKGSPTTVINTEPIHKENIVYTAINNDNLKKDITKKVDPFITMALSFCREIGQNSNQQNMNWCVEKALRRLKVIDLKMSPLMAARPPASLSTTAPEISQNEITISLTETSPTPKLQKQNAQSPVTTEDINAVMYFPGKNIDHYHHRTGSRRIRDVCGSESGLLLCHNAQKIWLPGAKVLGEHHQHPEDEFWQCFIMGQSKSPVHLLFIDEKLTILNTIANSKEAIKEVPEIIKRYHYNEEHKFFEEIMKCKKLADQVAGTTVSSDINTKNENKTEKDDKVVTIKVVIEISDKNQSKVSSKT
ncbi:jg23390 [Pararge aegeria aegeria]|uniref:Jg23390 protein n=1 Tax=Pararge aegeria aegeria TaxID=348720 RepID=A0A8S4RK16_9NEOP|nr:jg23390 [Pararge aegeria aegeria]